MCTNPLCIKFKLRSVYDNNETQIRSLENLNVKSDIYDPLLVPVLQFKIPNELNLIVNRRLYDLDFWDVIKALKVFKEELITREKLHSPEPNTDLFIASSLLPGIEKSKKILKSKNFLIKTINRKVAI